MDNRRQSAINIIALNTHFFAYDKLSTVQKIKCIVSTIERTIHDLERTQPESMNIFVWPEYGITGLHYKYIRPENKNLMKSLMLKLCEDHRSLVIIAGTIACAKKFSSFSAQDYQAILNEYKQNHYLVDMNDDNVKPHIDKIHALKYQRQQEVEVLKNSCFIFSKHHSFRYDKIAPFKEDKDENIDSLNMIFKPGRPRTRNRYFSIQHHFTNETLRFGIEICYEHEFRLLKKTINTNHLEKPVIQFLLSASISSLPASICSDFFVHVDSVIDPQCYITSNPSPYDIKMYQLPLTLETHELFAVAPIWKVEIDILNLIDKFLLVAKDSKFTEQTADLQLELKETNPRLSKNEFLLLIEEWLPEQQRLLNSYRSFFFFSAFSLETNEINLCQKLLDDIQVLLNKENAMDVDPSPLICR